MIKKLILNIIILIILISLIINYGFGAIIIKCGSFLGSSGKRIERIGEKIKEKENNIKKIFKWKEQRGDSPDSTTPLCRVRKSGTVPFLIILGEQ